MPLIDDYYVISSSRKIHLSVFNGESYPRYQSKDESLRAPNPERKCSWDRFYDLDEPLTNNNRNQKQKRHKRGSKKGKNTKKWNSKKNSKERKIKQMDVRVISYLDELTQHANTFQDQQIVMLGWFQQQVFEPHQKQGWRISELLPQSQQIESKDGQSYSFSHK